MTEINSVLIQMITHRKGAGNMYFPVAGETCLISPPHCDDESGYVFKEFQVLWTDETFLVYRAPGCWPTVAKWEHIRCKALEPVKCNIEEVQHDEEIPQ